MLRRLITVTALAAGLSVAAAIGWPRRRWPRDRPRRASRAPGWSTRSSFPATASPESRARLRCSPGRPACSLRCSVRAPACLTRRRPRREPRRRRPPSARGTPSPTPCPASPPARRAVRAGPPGPLTGYGQRAGHLHPTRPGRLRNATAGHRLAPGQSPADPDPGPARRAAATGHAGSPADPPFRRASSGRASNGLTKPRLPHRGSRGHRSRSTRRHRTAAASPQASHRARQRTQSQRTGRRVSLAGSLAA
jgi:hypothetical protein